MTNEELELRNAAQRYLQEVALLRRDVRRLALQVEKIRHDASGLRAIVYDRDKVMTSPTNMIEQQMVRLDELTERYATRLTEMHAAIQIREEQIRKMPKASHREILTYRYLQPRRMKLDKIAARMHMSDDRVRHLHTEALIEFARIYKVST